MKSGIIGLVLLLPFINLHAQEISYNQIFQVNTTIPGSTGNPCVAGLKHGGFVICWDEWNLDNGDDSIFGQLFDNNGAKIDSSFQINTYNTEAQFNPCISSLENGGFVVCWTSWGQDESGFGIFGQLFDETGQKFGSEIQVNTYAVDSQNDPCASGLVNGGFVICWVRYDQDERSVGIYGQRFNNQGVKLGEEFILLPFNMRQYQGLGYTQGGYPPGRFCGLS